MKFDGTATALRALGAVALTSVFAPATGSLLLFGGIAVLHPAKVGAPELVGLTMWAVMLGFLPTIACCVVALLCVWLARRFNVASRPSFAAGGAVLALSEWIAVTARDIAEWNLRAVVESADLVIVLAITGAVFGLIWWVILGRTLVHPSTDLLATHADD